jgi:hypothetical protein
MLRLRWRELETDLKSTAPVLDPTDEEGVETEVMVWLLRHRQTKEAETDRSIPNDDRSLSSTLLYLLILLITIQSDDAMDVKYASIHHTFLEV